MKLSSITALLAIATSSTLLATNPVPTTVVTPESASGYSATLPQASEKPGAGPRLSYNSVNTSEKVVALTFDDGPKPGETEKLLDLLKERGVKATFFLIGQEVERFPDLVARIAAEGHEVGAHSYHHKAFNKMTPDQLREDIEKTSAIIVSSGAPRPAVVRPPYGSTNAKINQRLNEEFQQKVILWSVDPIDWRDKKSDLVAQRVLKDTKPGSIVLAHDIHPTTVKAVPAILDGLQSQGYRFVTVSELVALDQPTPAAAPAKP